MRDVNAEEADARVGAFAWSGTGAQERQLGEGCDVGEVMSRAATATAFTATTAHANQVSWRKAHDFPSSCDAK